MTQQKTTATHDCASTGRASLALTSEPAEVSKRASVSSVQPSANQIDEVGDLNIHELQELALDLAFDLACLARQITADKRGSTNERRDTARHLRVYAQEFILVLAELDQQRGACVCYAKAHTHTDAGSCQ